MNQAARSLLLKLIIASALGGLLMPLLLIILLGLLAGMVMFLYFLFPLQSLVTGALAGRQLKSLWFFPLANGLFMFYWVLRSCAFELGVSFQFFGLYVLLGGVAMGLSAAVRWLTANRKAK